MFELKIKKTAGIAIGDFTEITDPNVDTTRFLHNINNGVITYTGPIGNYTNGYYLDGYYSGQTYVTPTYYKDTIYQINIVTITGFAFVLLAEFIGIDNTTNEEVKIQLWGQYNSGILNIEYGYNYGTNYASFVSLGGISTTYSLPSFMCRLCYENGFVGYMLSYSFNYTATVPAYVGLIRNLTTNCYYYCGFDIETLQNALNITIATEETSDEYGSASTTGGYTGGTFDDTSDTIAIPTMPTIGVTSAGFVNVYNPSVNALQGFGAELFPDLTFSGSSHISGSLSVSEAIEAAANALVDLGNQIPNIVNMYINSNLINYVIDCHILPVAPTVGTNANIKVGFKQFTASAPIVTSDYVDFDCGTLNVGEYYANFIDYSPYTRARLFLPFVGFVDLQPEFFQSGSVNIVYRFNIIDGSFMCYVLSTSSKSKLKNSVIMQFGGNACVHIPITGLNYSSMVSGVVGGAAQIVASQAGVSGLNQRAGSAITSAITSAVDVAQSKPPVQASNGYNATTSFLSVRTPYLLIERSVSNFSMKYTEEKGIPSNITTSFDKLSGFTQASAVHLDGIGATEEEKAEIAALLAQGVIL